MIRTVRANGRIYNVTGWTCKFDPIKNGCNCCEPKDALHPRIMSNPAIQSFAVPTKSRKSKAYVARLRSSYEGSAKSKRKN